MSVCHYVRKHGNKWEYGHQTLVFERQKPIRTYHPKGTCATYEEACLANEMALAGMPRMGFNHVNEKGVVKC